MVRYANDKQVGLAHFCARGTDVTCSCSAACAIENGVLVAIGSARQVEQSSFVKALTNQRKTVLARVQATLKQTKETRKDHPTAW